MNISNILPRLHAAILAVCPPLAGVSIGDVANKATWRVDAPGATAPQLAAAQAAIDGFSATERVPRSIMSIYQDLAAVAPTPGALTTAQKNAIWTDLISGSPVKIMASTGPSSDSIFVLWLIASNASLPAAMILAGKLAAAALYVRDNPTYLVHPAFDATINVPGDMVAP